MRSTLVALPLLAACTSGGDSNAFFCNQECADYYTIRAIDSVHAKVWSSVLANQPPEKDGTISYDGLEIPCVAGSLKVSGTATPSTSGAVTVDLSVVHEEQWQNGTAVVVGAKQGDLATPQFWVDKKNLLFTRLFQLGGRDKKVVQETQFNGYQKVKGGGWVSAEVKFIVDGKVVTTEEYTNIKTDTTLSSDLWNADKWMTVDRNYFK